ncbi:competence type IV pilus minor pilin ComGE [Streptococcus hongkongensis]|nr:competence protein ComGE [Streptococcus uberis]
MVPIKNQKIKAYILFESLVALGILVYIVIVILGSIRQYQQLHQQYKAEEEVLNSAIMAIQSRKNKLAINGTDIFVHSTEKEVVITNGQKEVLRISKVND